MSGRDDNAGLFSNSTCFCIPLQSPLSYIYQHKALVGTESYLVVIHLFTQGFIHCTVVFLRPKLSFSTCLCLQYPLLSAPGQSYYVLLCPSFLRSSLPSCSLWFPLQDSPWQIFPGVPFTCSNQITWLSLLLFVLIELLGDWRGMQDNMFEGKRI